MSMLSNLRAATMLSATLLAAPALAADQPDKHISFFVVGKTERHVQDLSEKLKPAGWYFFAEIFLKPNGKVDSASLTTPAETLTEFKQSRPDAYHIKRRDFATREELDRAFPDGTYRLTVATPDGGMPEQAVQMRLRPSDKGAFTAPIRISFQQDGKRARAAAIDPGNDVVVGWSKFAHGAADPKRIANDVMFAIVSDCDGKGVARTALPFEATPAYTFRDTSFRIPSDRLQPGSTYFVMLEHAELVDTQQAGGIAGLATFPAVTKGMFETTGSGGKLCPMP